MPLARGASLGGVRPPRPRPRGRAAGRHDAYALSMPTPVGPPSPDPDDPDLWDWGDDESFPRRRHPWRLLVVGTIVLGLVLLLAVSIL